VVDVAAVNSVTTTAQPAFAAPSNIDAMFGALLAEMAGQNAPADATAFTGTGFANNTALTPITAMAAANSASQPGVPADQATFLTAAANNAAPDNNGQAAANTAFTSASASASQSSTSDINALFARFAQQAAPATANSAASATQTTASQASASQTSASQTSRTEASASQTTTASSASQDSAQTPGFDTLASLLLRQMMPSQSQQAANAANSASATSQQTGDQQTDNQQAPDISGQELAMLSGQTAPQAAQPKTSASQTAATVVANSQQSAAAQVNSVQSPATDTPAQPVPAQAAPAQTGPTQTAQVQPEKTAQNQTDASALPSTIATNQTAGQVQAGQTGASQNQQSPANSASDALQTKADTASKPDLRFAAQAQTSGQTKSGPAKSEQAKSAQDKTDTADGRGADTTAQPQIPDTAQAVPTPAPAPIAAPAAAVNAPVPPQAAIQQAAQTGNDTSTAPAVAAETAARNGLQPKGEAKADTKSDAKLKPAAGKMAEGNSKDGTAKESGLAAANQGRSATSEQQSAPQTEQKPAGETFTQQLQHETTHPAPAAQEKPFHLADTAAPQQSPLAADPAKVTAEVHVGPQHQTADAPTALEKLGVSIAAKSSEGLHEFDIRLDPADLGRVHVHLKVDDDGQTQASVVADNPKTLELLQRDSSGLNRALQDAGLNLANNGLNFSLREQNRETGNNGQGRSRNLSARTVLSADAPQSRSSQGSYAPNSVQLDIRV
jgi:Flagellar hook-length control protein